MRDFRTAHFALARKVKWRTFPDNFHNSAHATIGSTECTVEKNRGLFRNAPNRYLLHIKGRPITEHKTRMEGKEAAARHALDVASAHERLELLASLEWKGTMRIDEKGRFIVEEQAEVQAGIQSRDTPDPA